MTRGEVANDDIFAAFAHSYAAAGIGDPGHHRERIQACRDRRSRLTVHTTARMLA